MLLKYEDNRVEDILAAIDQICGSNTTALYRSYKTDIILSRKQMVSSELDAIPLDYKQYLNTDLNSKALAKYNSVIAEVFASLPDGSIGICELGLEHIYHQLSLCLEKGTYNLVVYHHPSLKSVAIDYAEPQDPQEHKEQLDKYIIDNTYFDDLIIPTIFKTTYENDSNNRELIQRAFLLFKNRDFSLQDITLQNGQSTIYFKDVTNIGGLLRLARYNDNTLTIKYLFVPGNTVEQINKNLEKFVTEEGSNAQEKKLLLRFTQVIDAGKDI